jgi:hypothetical protein
MGGMVLSSIVSSQIVQRLGRYKFMILGGLLVVAAAFWWLTTMDVNTTLNGVRLRMVLLGVGLGPAMPTLTLALQNAVPFEVVGSATASRQFFQQLGQVISSAIFGAILTTTLTASLTANLAPVTAQLPPELAAQFDVSRLRNGVAAAEGTTGEPVSIENQIEQRIKAQFDEQRALIAKAIRDDDPAAKQALLANPQTPAQLREALQAGIPATAREQVLEQVNAGLDQAEASALAQGEQIGGQVSGAIKQAFTDSVTGIYWYAIPLVLVAFVLALFIPELPLRRTNSVPAVAIE